MKPEVDLTYLNIKGLTLGFERRDFTPTQVFKAYAARIDRYNAKINAFLHLRFEQAETEARAATQRWKSGIPRSRIDGIPFGVKANIAVKGLPFHGGIRAYKDQIAQEDALCVENLTKNGAICLGILNMHEGALGATTDNAYFGKCYNPWGRGLTPGGSSGGSGAAVAARFCAFALGTDTMGSVRIPSAYCGIAGHKPSRGIVPVDGVMDLSPTLDHIGAHAQTAADLKLVLPYLSGISAETSSLSSLVIGVAKWGQAIDEDRAVKEAFERSLPLLKDLGELKEIDLSHIEFGRLRRRGLLISEVEGHKVHRQKLLEDADGFSPEFRSLLEWGASQPQEKIDSAYRELKEAGVLFAKILSTVDVLVMPTAPQGPFTFDMNVPANQADFTCLANFAGVPATAIAGELGGQPPASIQFIAKKGADSLTLEVSSAYEDMRGALPVTLNVL